MAQSGKLTSMGSVRGPKRNKRHDKKEEKVTICVYQNKIIFDKEKEHTVLQSHYFLKERRSSNEINQTSRAAFRFSIGRINDSTTTGGITEPHATSAARYPILENYPTFSNITNATRTKFMMLCIIAYQRSPLEKKSIIANDIGVFYYLQFQQKSSTSSNEAGATGCHFFYLLIHSLRQTDAQLFRIVSAKRLGFLDWLKIISLGAPVTP
jgi:hypothetical protein